MVLSGHCLCGQTTFTTDAEPLIKGRDHCDDCQRQTGSTYSFVIVVPKATLKVTGPTKEYAAPGDSGKLVRRVFCSNCGSPITHAPDAAPEIVAIKGGVLDTQYKKALTPDTDIYFKDALPGVSPLENSHQRMP